MRNSRLLAIIGAALFLGALAGWVRPVPSSSAGAEEADGAWALPPPTALERSNAELFQAALNLAWVGGGTTLGTDGEGRSQVEDTTWTLRGVMPAEGLVLAQIGGNTTVQALSTGDILPDGMRIAIVEPDSIVVEQNGCHIRRHLYPGASGDALHQEGECLELPSDKEQMHP